MNHARFGSMIAAALVCATAFTAAAQQPQAKDGNKIGFVDVQRVLRESAVSLQVQKTLDAEHQKRTKEIEAGPADAVQRRKTGLAEDMALRRQEALAQFVQRTNRVIKKVAEAEKFDVVVIEASYAGARINITDRVIKALDAER